MRKSLKSRVNFKGRYHPKEHEVKIDLGVENLICSPFKFKKTVRSSFSIKPNGVSKRKPSR